MQMNCCSHLYRVDYELQVSYIYIHNLNVQVSRGLPVDREGSQASASQSQRGEQQPL